SSLQEAAPRVLEAICDCLGWSFASIWAADDDSGSLRCAHSWHGEDVSVSRMADSCGEISLARGEGLPGRVWETGTSIWIPDITAESNFPRRQLALSDGLHAGFAFPIPGSSGVIGVIEAYSDAVLAPDEKMAEALSAFGRQLGQFIERTRVEGSLRRSEARKQAMFEAALDCIVGMDHAGAITEFNPAAEETFGYNRDDVIGKQLAETIIPLPYRQLHYDGLARYLETGEHAVLGRRIQITGLRADGTEFPIELAIIPVNLPNEAPTFTAYVRDITAHIEAEEEHARLLMSEQAARAQAEVTEQRIAFLADVHTRLAARLDYQSALETLAEMSVPQLADWCLIDVAAEDGEVRRVAVSHADPARSSLAETLYRESPKRSFVAIQRVLETGRSILIEDVEENELPGLVASYRTNLLRELQATSVMIVPLVARGRTLGTLTFVHAESGRVYTSDDLSLAEDLAQRAAVSIDNARLFQERSHVARTLQRSLLPPRPPAIPGIDVAARYEAAGEGNEVGGDFYDVFRCGRQRWAIVMGDVCGKGPDAAAVTGLARYTLRAAQFESNAPSQILPGLNKAILEQSSGERFATVVLALLETGRKGARLTVCSAGHPLPLIRHQDGTVEELGEPGTVLGILDEVELTDATVRLQPGDSILFYTDGVTDTGVAEDSPEAVDLHRLLRSSPGDDASTLANQVRDAALNAQGGTARDDIAVLVLRVPGSDAEAQPPTFELRLEEQVSGGFAAAGVARKLLDELAGEIDQELLEDARFLVNEVVTNSVKHARVDTHQHVRIRVLSSDSAIRVEVTDPGEGFSPRPRSPVAGQDSGWGMYLVEQISDRWGSERSDDGFTLWFEIDKLRRVVEIRE
ncbi:MAG: SpoIIE family protein phosphatase, partial [Actinomycetota bacterium]|nr:SpoIIE family protein phosphatase [Actinomycetota bacterium]